MTDVILDTNILVAAGFNSRSSSATIVEMIQQRQLTLLWDDATLRESKKIVKQIPPLDWSDFAKMYDEQKKLTHELDLSQFSMIDDYDDRKFAALATFTKAVLISNDDHLLSVRDELSCQVLTPSEFLDLNKN